MADFQFTEFPINATPLADVSEITSADGVLVVRNGAVQKVPLASFLAAVGAQPSANMVDYVQKTTEINGYPLSSDVDLAASDIPYTPATPLTADNVQSAITEAARLIEVRRETDLYSGDASAAGSYTLLDTVANYQYIDIYTTFSGRNEIRRFPVDEGQTYCMRFLNLADSNTSTFVGWSEIAFVVNGTSLTINHNKYVNWSGTVNSNAVVATNGKPSILKVVGIKYDILANIISS